MTNLDRLLLSGQTSGMLRQRLLEHLGNDVFWDGDDGRQARARDAILLIVNSPEYLVQK